MDKQKQIDEMARVLTPCPRNTCVGCGMECIDYRMAKAIYNAGYRKITENAVVLTGTETEQRFEDLMVAFDEMGFMPNTTHPFPEEYVETWKQRLIFVFGQVRKETAERFAEMAKNKAGKQTMRMNGVEIYECTTYTLSSVDIDEICKDLSEGKV